MRTKLITFTCLTLLTLFMSATAPAQSVTVDHSTEGTQATEARQSTVRKKSVVRVQTTAGGSEVRESTQTQMKAVGRFSGGPSVEITTHLEGQGDSKALLGGGIMLDQSNVIHRHLSVQDSMHYGYDLVVEPIAGTLQFKVSFQPLDPKTVQHLRDKRSGRDPGQDFEVSPLPRYPDPQVVSAGDVLALDILINPQTGMKIVDRIKVTSEN